MRLINRLRIRRALRHRRGTLRYRPEIHARCYDMTWPGVRALMGRELESGQCTVPEPEWLGALLRRWREERGISRREQKIMAASIIATAFKDLDAPAFIEADSLDFEKLRQSWRRAPAPAPPMVFAQREPVVFQPGGFYRVRTKRDVYAWIDPWEGRE